MILSVAIGCRSKKVVVDKKETSVNEITRKDFRTSESAKIQTETFILDETKSWQIMPVDSRISANVVYKGDTLQLSNAKLEVNTSHSQKRENQVKVVNKNSTDKSTGERQEESEEVHKDKNVRSTSWGLNLGIIFGVIAGLILLYFHFNRPR